MPSLYRVQSPDGRSWEVNVPDGVTQEMVVSRLASSGFFDQNKDSPALSKVMSQPVPRTSEEARARDNVTEPEDSWLETGRKFFNRIGPLFKQVGGGALQAMSEIGQQQNPDVMREVFGVQSPEELKRLMEEDRRAGRTPGVKLYKDATRDLEANAYRPGDSSLKKYAPMVAESVVQMVPAIAAALATRNPGTAGAIMGGQVGGSQYGESRDMGRSPEAALADSAFMGAAEAIGESIPLRIMMKPGGKFLEKTLKAMGAEGLQEMFTQTLQTGYDKGLLHPDMTWGEAFEQVRDAGIVGAFTGGTLAIGVDAVDRSGRIVTDKLAARRPVTEGVAAQAVGASQAVSPEDAASPLPTDLIQQGRSAAAQALGGGKADDILSRHGMPKTGAQVQVDMGDGRTVQGVMSDAFEDGDARGLVITMPDGKIMREHFDDLADAGVTISARTEADEIDARLAAEAAQSTTREPQLPAVPVPSDQSQSTAPRPVADAKAILEQVHPGAVATSWKRGKNDPLTKANPTSYHPTGAAIDVRPMKDKTFEQFVQGFRDEGYEIIEALNETGAGRSKHATGDHWHVVLGEKSGAAQTALDIGAGQDGAVPPSEPAPVTGEAAPAVEPARPSLLDEAADHPARAREVAIGLVRDGMKTAGFNDDATFSFGHRLGLQQGPYNRPGQLNIELRDQPGVVHSFKIKDIEAAARASTAEAPAPTASARIEDTGTGKSIAISGATPAQLALVRRAIPNAQPIQRQDGAIVYSKKYREKVEAALASSERAGQDMAGAAIDKDWTKFSDTSGTLDIPRAEMPQVKAEHRGAMVNFLNARGVAHQEDEVSAEVLRPSQREFSPAKVQQAKDFDGGNRAILVSQDAHVVDGHHQWLAARDNGEKVRIIKLDAPASDLVPMMREFPSSEIADGASVAGAAQPEHPGLRIHNLRTGKEQVIQPRGTVPPASGTTKTRKAIADAKMPKGYKLVERDGRVVFESANGDMGVGGDTDLGPIESVTQAQIDKAVKDARDDAEILLPAEREALSAYKPKGKREADLRDEMLRNGRTDGGSGHEDLLMKAIRSSEKPEPTPPAPSQPDGYGAKNKLVSQDRAAELRDRLKKKLSGTQLNSGVDPETLAIGAELAVFHIEAGARRFADLARAIASDLDLSVRDLRRYLRGWYNGARDMMEDSGESVVGMDGPEEVARAMRTIDEWADVTTGQQGGKEAADGLQGTVSHRDAAASTGNVPGAAQDGGAERASPAEERGGSRPVRATDPGSREVAERRDQGSDDPGRGREPGALNARRVPADLKGANWVIEPGALEEARSPAQKARDNVAAIEIVKQLDESGRVATAEQQATIAKYVGWGGLKNIFPGADGSFGKGFESLGPRLRELLTDQEYDTARRSIQYAHYTSEKVIRPMWELAQRLGFSGGLVFEPGMGTGNFLGMMPPALAGSTRYEGIEFDHLTQRIAHHLYPQSGVRQADYTRSPRVVDAFDLAIGNPPFSATVIKSDPAYAKLGFLMHDFFFAKTLDAVKPGGLLMFVTSAGTMNKVDASAREYLAERADLLGAIRLPSTAFSQNAGTAVTTDIIVLRKRLPGEQAAATGWTETRSIDLPSRDGGMTQGNVSAYFLDNPDMILGEQGMFDQLAASVRYGVRPTPGQNLEEALRAAMERIDAKPIATAPVLQEADEPAVEFNIHERKEGSFYLSDKGELMQLQSGAGRAVRQRGKGVTGGLAADSFEKVKALVGLRDALRETLAADLSRDAAKAAPARERLNALYDGFTKKHGPINKTVTQFRRPTIIQQESARMRAREEARMNMQPWDEGTFDATPLIEAGISTMELARARRDARDAARALGRPFDEGTFNPEDMDDIAIVKRPNIDPFMADQESYRLRSIEHYDDNTDTGRKGLIFYESPLTRETKPQINSIEDALLYTLNRVGRPDVDMIAREAGTSTDEVLDRLSAKLFKLPGTDRYEVSELYLSGNVREKLDIARRAADSDPSLERNVRALEAVQPPPLSKTDIAAGLGMPWIPEKYVEQFAQTSLGIADMRVNYQPKLAQWNVTGDRLSAASRSQWGTDDRQAPQLLADALNRATPKIFREFTDAGGSKKRVLDEQATQAVQDKVIEIKAAFRDWIWADDARTSELEQLYNREFNSRVAPEFDGSYMTTPGVSAAWSWRPHQRNVIARIVQAGNTYMAHGVGAGKTSAMIGAGMEMKRLGLVNKPSYVVPNHMLGQFTKEFYEQYPTARIMVADEARFHTDRRKQFVADVANSDLDAVIMTHSSFELLPVDAAYLDRMLEAQIDEYREMLEEIDKAQENRITRSRIEQQIEALEQRLSVNQNARKDAVYTFEETGIDFLFVDEAHLFRKLSFSTKMGNVKGIDPDGSQASFDLFAKIQRLEESRPGRAVVLASGTPITNTMAELYTVQRMMQMGELRKLGISQFDAWAGAFGDTDTKLEQDPAGGYKPVTRFAKFVNVPELSVMVRQFMDVVTSQELESLVVRPKLKGGKRNMIVVEQNDDQLAFGESLRRRMEAIEKRKRPPQKGDDILLTVINDGRKAAIDMRLVAKTYDREDSKLEKLIDNVHRIWAGSKRQPFHAIERDGYSAKPVDFGPATQMVFADLGVNPTGEGIGVHDYIRAQLIARGVPANEIALMGQFKNTVQKQRLFNDMNEGKVRVLVGSVAKMGTGVNAQRRLLANHNLDAQWYPANDEQRNGRIIRQGNMNPEVELFDYSTKGTYDSTMWQLMETKARFIEGFMRGDPTMRDMEDLGEASQYEQAKALTTADPRIMHLTELRQALDKAMLRKGAFERSLSSARWEISSSKSTIERLDQRIPEIEADIAQRVDIKGEAFSGRIGEVTYTERAEFGAGLLAAMDAIAETKTVGGRPRKIGSMGGFDIYAQAYGRGGEMHVEAYIALNGENTSTLKETKSAAGLVAAISNKLDAFERSLEYARSEIEIAKERIEQFTPELMKTFEGQEEIDRLSDEVRTLERVLEDESAAARKATQAAAPAPAERQSRLDEPVAVLTGEEIAPIGADISTLRERAFAWYNKTYLGRTVTTSDGREVSFNGRGMRKATSKGEFLLRSIPAIRAIIEQGTFSSSQPGRDSATKAMHNYVATVEVAGDRRLVGLSVRETPQGQFKYDLFMAREELVGGQSSPTDGERQSRTGQFGITPDDINLFIVDDESNGAPNRVSPLDLADLRARLTAVGIADRIAGSVVESLGGVGGRYMSGLIEVATGVAQDGHFTMNHEIVHAMRDMDLFMPAEWGALSRRARADAALTASVQRRYPELDTERQTEEAVADLFAQWVRDRAERGMIGRAFDRIRTFLDALHNWAQGHGFVSAEGVLRAMDTGAVGTREGQPGSSGERSSRLDTARATLASFAGKGSTFSAEGAAMFDRWRTAVQDRYLPLLRTQQAIEVQLGKPIGEAANPYLGEELMTGRIGNKLERLSDDMLAPLLDDMHASGIEIDELETFLYARHAPERNAQISSINPDFMPGEGSGMTDIEARAIMNRVERDGKMRDMERLASQIDGILDWALAERVDAGLMSQDEVDAWRKTYQHYVPLRGNREMDGDGTGIRINRSGGGINVRGRESRRAYGRKSEAENILSYVVLQAEEAVVRGETNRVAQQFVRLAERAPDEGFWKVDKVTRKPVMDESTGMVRYEEQSRIQPEDADFTVSAKFDGEERRVTMNRANPAARRLADSMRNLTQQQLDWVTQHLGKLNRFLSAVNTSWNPEFVITNAFRDIQTAAVNLTGFDEKGMVTGTLRDYRRALVAATKGEFKRGSGEWQRWYDEFQAEGGRVSFNQLEDVAGIKDRLRKTFAMTAARGTAPKLDMLTVKRGFVALRDTIGALNGGVENAIRLAAYKNARERGMSKARAASLAKNLTVNFNRRGQMGPAINAAYLFFNASLQGSARIMIAIKSPRVRKLLAAVAVGGFIMEMVNAMVSDDDDDGEAFYDKVPDFDKSRNFVIMLPDGRSYVKVPMPYGYNVFSNAGRTLAEIARRGGDRWLESGAHFISSVVDAFNPVGGTQSLLNFLSPTAFDPIVDLTLNEDFAGRPIQPVQNPFAEPKPDHLNYFSSVGPQWRAMTDTLAELTGGDDVQPGAIDVSPETLEYLSGTVLGAAGAFVDRTAGLGAKALDPEAEVTANDLPMVRKVIGQKPSWYDKDAYYQRVNTIDQAVAYANNYREREDAEGFEAYVASKDKLLSLEPVKKEAEREMRKIRKARREVDFAHQMEKLDDDSWRVQRGEVADAEKGVVGAFNRRWNETMTPAP